MLAIEAKRILQDGAVLFIVLAAIATGIAFSDQDVFLAPAMEIFLLLYASFTGWALFERERQENAMEYMLSLPLSRGRLLLLKLLPRLLCIALVLFIYLSLHQFWQLPSLLSPLDFSILYSGIFLLSSAFSISFKNFPSAFFTASLLSVGQVLLIKLLDNDRSISQAVLQANVAVMVFPLLFFILFRRYDIKPVAYFNRKFFPGLLLLAGLITGFIFYQAPDNWKNINLTSGGWVLRNSCKQSQITLAHGRYRFRECLMLLRESAEGSTLYALAAKKPDNGPCSEKSIVTIDLKSGALKTVFKLDPGWSVHSGYNGEIGAIRAGTYSIFLHNPKLKKAMLLKVRDEKVSEMPIGGDFYDPDIGYVYYPDRSPEQLVIFSGRRLYRLDISGKVQELAQADALNVWQDKMLLLDSSGLKLFRIGEELMPLLQRKGTFQKSRRRIGGFESRSVIYHCNREYYWLDMENQKESRLELKAAPYTYQQSGDTFNVVFASGSTFTMLQIRGEEQRETIWEAGFQPSAIRISPFGFLVFRDQKYRIYKFNK
jgi:ABC-type transport system involved in multi-copper enzyme maturation permease subunit